MTADTTASSTEAGFQVANHLVTARPVLSLVEGSKAPPLIYPQGKRVSAYLSGGHSYMNSRCPPGGVSPEYLQTPLPGRYAIGFQLLCRDVPSLRNVVMQMNMNTRITHEPITVMAAVTVEFVLNRINIRNTPTPAATNSSTQKKLRHSLISEDSLIRATCLTTSALRNLKKSEKKG
ncbi:hypothetical protein AVEN_238247-1 [Araneus ventricosus]|uniref:Uncharacterized protein n=1 Tax=Araneus ventricosus TaxID=182803 RepID=A0A4Y2N7Q3_ARAVE|nr:hypothetical protein AVEN_238247-1 [Araneus ventricosus]